MTEPKTKIKGPTLKERIKQHSRGLALIGVLMAGEAKADWTDWLNISGGADNIVEAGGSLLNSSALKSEYNARIQEAYADAVLDRQVEDNEFLRDLTNMLGLPNNTPVEDIFPNFEKCKQAKTLDEFKQMYWGESVKYATLVDRLPSKLNSHLRAQFRINDKYGNKSMKLEKKLAKKLKKNTKWGTSQFKGISAGTFWGEKTKTKNSKVSKGFQIAGNAGTALRAAIEMTDSSTWSAEAGHAMNFNATSYTDIQVSEALIRMLKDAGHDINSTAKYGYDLATKAGDTDYQGKMRADMGLTGLDALVDSKFEHVYETQDKELRDIAQATNKLTGSYKAELNRKKMLEKTGYLSDAVEGINGYYKSTKTR